jgi:hypothetical protein
MMSEEICEDDLKILLTQFVLCSPGDPIFKEAAEVIKKGFRTLRAERDRLLQRLEEANETIRQLQKLIGPDCVEGGDHGTEGRR